MNRTAIRIILALGFFAATHAVAQPQPVKQFAPEELKNMQTRIASLIEQGRKMETLRERSDLEALGMCGDRMRLLQPQAIALRDETMRVPLEQNGLPLRMAAGHVRDCVSCSRRSALEGCNMAADALKQISK